MNPNLTKRGFIRILSYFTALCVFLGVGALINYQAAQRYRQNSEYGYQRALSDLSDSVSNLEVALDKGVYANTEPQQQGIAAKPVSYTHLALLRQKGMLDAHAPHVELV